MAAVALKQVAATQQQQSANAVSAGTFYSFGHQCPGSGTRPAALPPFRYRSSPTCLLSHSLY